MKRIMGVYLGVRYFLKKCKRRRAYWVEPDEDDLARATADDLLAFWAFWREWGEKTRKRRPGWRVNGTAAGEQEVLWGGEGLAPNSSDAEPEDAPV